MKVELTRVARSADFAFENQLLPAGGEVLEATGLTQLGCEFRALDRVELRQGPAGKRAAGSLREGFQHDTECRRAGRDASGARPNCTNIRA